MFKVILAMLLAVILLFGFVIPSPEGEVQRSAEFPADDSAAGSAGKVPVAEVNSLPVGARLYHRLSQGPLGIVAATDPAREFDDGEIVPAVLVEFKDGTRFWLRHEKVKQLLTERVQPKGNGRNSQ